MEYLKIDSEVVGKCIDYSSDGKGVIKYEDFTIFVSNLILDEEARVVINYKRAGVYYASIKELIVFSPYRQNGICKVSASCGGCCFGKLQYEKTLEFKANKITKCIRKVGSKDLYPIEVIPNPNSLGYRNKIVIQARMIKGKKMLGFFKEGSHDIVNLTSCSISNQSINIIFSSIRDLILNSGVSFYDDTLQTGVLRGIQIRYSTRNRESLLTLILTKYNQTDDRISNLLNDIKKIKDEVHIKAISININDTNSNVLLGDKTIAYLGNDSISETLGDLRFKISSSSFFQVNTQGAQALFSEAIKLALLKQDDIVFDAYCGVGTISLLISSQVSKVVGVEIVPTSIIDAKQNASINSISNVEFIASDVVDYLNNTKVVFDVVFLDPPRKGLDSLFTNALLRTLPKKIIYISCDPATLSRDIEILLSKYHLTTIKGVDMFSYTWHVECIAVLELN